MSLEVRGSAWLNPRDPRGITLLGTLAMCAAGALLWSQHGRLEEVWPNRCDLLRAQLSQDARYALTAHKLTSPHLLKPEASVTLLNNKLTSQPHLLDTHELQARLVERSPTGDTLLTIELRYQPTQVIDELLKGLTLERGRDALKVNVAELTRLGLSVSPSALTCARAEQSRELPVALALLLKGGLLPPLPSKGSLEPSALESLGRESLGRESLGMDVGLWGERGWWVSAQGQVRFWRPLTAEGRTEGSYQPLLLITRQPLEGAQTTQGVRLAQDLSSERLRLLLSATSSDLELFSAWVSLASTRSRAE